MNSKSKNYQDDNLIKLDHQLISENNILRKEKILVLPYNTLRVFDTCLQADLERIKDPNWNGDFETTLKHVLTRTEKDLGKFNGIDSDMVNKLMNEAWIHYYEIAPKTNLYSLLDILNKQSFVSDIIVLFPKKGISEDDYTNAYYDGSIEELENFINKNSITAIVMDDVELLMTLINRGNVDLNWKTIIISKLGYNYMRTQDGVLVMKHSLEFNEKYTLEVGSLSLIDF